LLLSRLRALRLVDQLFCIFRTGEALSLGPQIQTKVWCPDCILKLAHDS